MTAFGEIRPEARADLGAHEATGLQGVRLHGEVTRCEQIFHGEPNGGMAQGLEPPVIEPRRECRPRVDGGQAASFQLFGDKFIDPTAIQSDS